jgi:hypothetical protein
MVAHGGTWCNGGTWWYTVVQCNGGAVVVMENGDGGAVVVRAKVLGSKECNVSGAQRLWVDFLRFERAF